MNRLKIVVLALMLLGLIGCALDTITPPSVAPTVKIIQENTGWVQVEVSGVTTPGYKLQWGDVGTASGFSDVLPYQESYEHAYQEPGQYTITLKDENNAIIDQVTALVSSLDCHVSLVEVEGRSIVVRYFGRYGIDYSIVWGDRHATSITTMSGTGLLSHTYKAAGTYAVSMGELWAPSRSFFTVTVE